MDDLAEVLQILFARYDYTPGQAGRLANLPKNTIVNWLTGRVQKPREWQPVVQLARALRLTLAETNQLLQAAGHPSVADLAHLAPQQKATFDYWLTTTSLPNKPLLAPFQAPPDLPYFVGRATLLDQLQQQLAKSPHDHLYLIHGQGGVGKTALATRLAYLSRPFFPDGVLWVNLAQADPMGILRSFAEAFGQNVAHYLTLDDRSRVVRSLLAHKQVLLVFDEVSEGSLLPLLLPPSGPCAVLLLARRPLWSLPAGIKAWPLHPFEASEKAAHQLLAHVRGAPLEPEEEPWAEQLAHLVGQLPLALMILAHRLTAEPGWSLASLVAQLQEANSRWELVQDETGRVSTAVVGGFEPLTPLQREWVAPLAWLGRAEITAEMVGEVAGLSPAEGLAWVRRLVQVGLLQSSSTHLYTIHPLVQDFLALQPEAPAGQEQLLHYWLKFAQTASSEIIQNLHPHFVAILRVANKNKPLHPLGLALLEQIWKVWLAVGWWQTAAEWAEIATEWAKPNPAGVGIWVLRQAQVARSQSEWHKTARYLAQAEPLLEHTPAGRVAWLTEQGVYEACQARPALARQWFTQALQSAREHHLNQALPKLLEELGIMAIQDDQDDLALALYTEGWQLVQDGQNPAGLIVLSKSLGAWYLLQKQWRKAEQILRQGYEVANQEQALLDMIYLLVNLGAVALIQEKWGEAYHWLAEAVSYEAQLANSRGRAMVWCNYGLWAWFTDRDVLAQSAIHQAEEFALVAGANNVLSRIELLKKWWAEGGEKPTIFPVIVL